MPQTPPGKERILRLDGSVVDEFGNVVSQTSTQPSLPLAPGPSTGEGDIGKFDPRDFLSGMIKIGTGLTSLGGSSSLPMIALRTALGAGGDALAAGVKGDDPLQAAMVGGGLNAGGELLGSAASAVATPLALMSGGGFNSIKDVGKVSKAFNREADRRTVPILVGQHKRAKAEKLAAGKNLEKVESANPNTVGLTQMQNANADYSKSAINTMDVFSLRDLIDKTDKTFIEGQALARNGLDEASFRQAVVQSAQDPNFMARLGQQIGKPVPTIADVRQLMMNHLIDNTELSARELGELKRGVRSQGRDVVNARQQNQWVPPAEAQKQQIAANNSKRMQELYESIDRDTRTPWQRFGSPDPGPDMQRANVRYSDLAMMEEASRLLRSDPSIFGIRAAIGSGTAPVFGIPRTLGGLAGLLAIPEAISGLGFGTKAVGRFGPGAWRGVEGIQELVEEGKDVKRRKP